MENLPKTIMIVDIESAGAIARPFIYDIGYIIAVLENGKYRKVKERSYLISEVFRNYDLFSTGYYANKRELYEQKLESKEIISHRREWVFDKMQQDIDNYNVEYQVAFNNSFDAPGIKYNADRYCLNNPIASLKKNCIWLMAMNTICQSPNYKEFVKENKLLTDSKKGYSTNAENIYKFLKQDLEFIEEHTGLADARIELEILNEIITNYNVDFETTYKKKFLPITTPKNHKIVIKDSQTRETLETYEIENCVKKTEYTKSNSTYFYTK